MKNIPDKPGGRFKIFLYLQENKVQKSTSALFCVVISTDLFTGTWLSSYLLQGMLPSLELVVAKVTRTLWCDKSFGVSEKESK